MEEFEKKKQEIEVCKEDLVVVFHLGNMLKPSKRKIIDKAVNKLPSTVLAFNWG